MYTLPSLITPFHGALAEESMLVVLACVVGGTWAACSTELHAVPAVLMRPKAPSIGKRVLMEKMTALWRRMSFNEKVTARNLFRYKKRFWMSVLGIAGSCALILTGFGLRDSITLSLEGQFREVWHMDMMVNLSQGMAEDDFDMMCAPLLNGDDFVSVVTGWQQL
jgi:putative ABC transport system permease protein